MTIQRIIELLEIEHECILRNSHDDCDRNCADCDLVQDDEELHEMYTDAIALLKEQDDVIPIKLVAEFLADYAFPPTDRNAIVYHESKAEMEWEQFLRDLKGR